MTRNVVDMVDSDDFAFESRGDVQVKGKGMVETYFLLERKRQPEGLAPPPIPGRTSFREENLRQSSLIDLVDLIPVDTGHGEQEY